MYVHGGIKDVKTDRVVGLPAWVPAPPGTAGQGDQRGDGVACDKVGGSGANISSPLWEGIHDVHVLIDGGPVCRPRKPISAFDDLHGEWGVHGHWGPLLTLLRESISIFTLKLAKGDGSLGQCFEGVCVHAEDEA